MSGASIPAWQSRLFRRFRMQPKKAATLTLLALVMVVMWGKVFFTGKPGPATASASLTPAGAAAESLTMAGPSVSPAAQALQEFARSQVGLLHRNLFLVKLDYFVQDGTGRTNEPNLSEGFWDELGKSFAAKADQEKAKRILVENLQSQAGRLELQSTVMSNGAPKAMINGTLVGEGDVIAGFRVLRIEAKRIIVEREGVKLEVGFRF